MKLEDIKRGMIVCADYDITRRIHYILKVDRIEEDRVWASDIISVDKMRDGGTENYHSGGSFFIYPNYTFYEPSDKDRRWFEACRMDRRCLDSKQFPEYLVETYSIF